MLKISKTYSILLVFLILAMAFPVCSQAVEKSEYVVVIDAGHGGHDVGANDNGFQEKDLNLAVAQKVGELVNKKLKNVKVVFTRSGDTYITLQERANRANRAKADLFISIHTNSVAESNPNRRTVAGASVYTLGASKDDKNMEVAQRENAVIQLEKNSKERYAGFDPNSDESYIIFEMAQKKNLSQSIKFAKEVQTNLVKTAKRGDRGVHQAGFWVLWATSMPSVLVEMDFICNPNSAKYLGSKQGQAQIAEAIADAIETYFKAQSKSGKHTSQVDDEEEADETDNTEYAVSAPPADGSKLRRSELIKTNQNTAQTQLQKRQSTRANTQIKRRRRNEVAERESNGRVVAVETMELHQPVAVSSHVADSAEPVVKKENSDKPATKKQTTAKKETKRNDNKKKHAQREKVVTIWTIQLLVADAPLSSSNTIFAGLSPITMSKENNLYKYYYGESTSRAEIESLLKSVKESVPDAKLVKTTKIVKQK